MKAVTLGFLDWLETLNNLGILHLNQGILLFGKGKKKQTFITQLLWNEDAHSNNQFTIYTASNIVCHERTKHAELIYYFIYDGVMLNRICSLFTCFEDLHRVSFILSSNSCLQS